MPGMDIVLENLENPQNSFAVRVTLFRDSVRELEILKTESSYADMLQKLMGISERLVVEIKGTNGFDERILQEYVSCYREIRKELSKYQIIFIGNAAKAMVLSGLVDKERAHVLEGGDACHKIPDYCDYVIILDEDGALGEVPAHSKIIRLDKILAKYDISPETAYWDKKLRQSLGSRKGYITGLSYEQRGIIWDKIGFGLGCLAAPSQDLFVDILSYMEIYSETKKKYGVELKYCVLGMNFYALWYDLSLSAQSGRMLCFYDRIKTLHHLNMIDMAGLAEDMSFCREIFAENFLDRYYERYYQDCIRKLEIPNVNEYDPASSYEHDIQEIKKLFHKPYEHTYLENTEMIKRFFEWLRLHDIKTIVYIPPFPALFNEYTPDVMRDRTLSFLQGLQKDFDFEIFDISDEREVFDNSCFADWSHLNVGGAAKATELLNAFMQKVWGEREKKF